MIMKKIFLTICLTTASTMFIVAQSIEWAHLISGVGYEYGVETATDSDGNIYWTGYATDTLVYQGVPISPNGRGDGYISKLSPDGEFLWIKTFGGDDPVYYDWVTDIHIDSNGDCYLTLRVSGFNFLYDGQLLPGIGAVGQYSGAGVLLKLDADGNLIWWESDDMQSFEEVSTDEDNNVYLTGWFAGEGTIGGQTLTNSTPGATTDMFIAKFTPAGNLVWVRHVGGNENNAFIYGIDIAFVPSGNCIYVTGNARKTAYFETATLTPLQVNAIYLVKYDTSGTEKWAELLENGQYRVAVSMDISAGGKIGICGYNSYYTDNTESFYGIYASDGDPLFTANPYSTVKSNMYGITFNASGEFYVSGYFEDYINLFDSSYSVPGPNSIIVKYTSNYQIVWAAIIPGEKFQTSVQPVSDGLIYTGRLFETLYYNQDTLIQVLADALILKIKDSGLNTSVYSMREKESFTVYPNPAKNYIWAESVGKTVSTIRILNNSGKLIRIVKNPGILSRIDLNACKPGIYYIITDYKDKSSDLKKFIIR